MSSFNNIVLARDRANDPRIKMLAQYLSKLANTHMPEPEEDIYLPCVYIAEAFLTEPIARATFNEMLATLTDQAQLDI